MNSRIHLAVVFREPMHKFIVSREGVRRQRRKRTICPSLHELQVLPQLPLLLKLHIQRVQVRIHKPKQTRELGALLERSVNQPASERYIGGPLTLPLMISLIVISSYSSSTPTADDALNGDGHRD